MKFRVKIEDRLLFVYRTLEFDAESEQELLEYIKNDRPTYVVVSVEEVTDANQRRS